jgi:V/A-type H+-transporting ATPase subunit F
MEQGNIAVIGDRDSVMLWRALGIDTVFAEKPGEIERAIHRLARDGTSVIYITEQAAQQVKEAVDRYKTESYPAIILIPNREGSTGLGMRGIRENIEKAIGADILFEEEE